MIIMILAVKGGFLKILRPWTLRSTATSIAKSATKMTDDTTAHYAIKRIQEVPQIRGGDWAEFFCNIA